MNSHPARLRRLVALAALSLTLLPATAIAQTPSDDGYEADGPTVQNQIESGGPGASPESGTESGTDPSASAGSDGGEKAGLPFTGLDLGLLAGAGVLLVGLGAGMRLVLRAPPAVR
jgi:hypothetical protein